MECFVCIHCHFYQPPRENPWLEAVESQDSANPHHDWNERIAEECYLPNGASRILDSQYRIAKIVNNYARISFNFGPTLLSWMEEREPEGYQRILEADRESQRLFSGHGAAIAQAYNHTILPLANSRDKRTQILWGLRDFQRRFGRDPEGMWLPETAVDVETLEILSAEGIKFTILAPRQAGQIRVENDSPWIDLQYGIDSRRAYACPLPSGRTIGLFFYDGVTSTAVAFERLLFSGENFARRLLSRFDPEGDSAQLMHVATDGESYGHHHAHGDMALAYALHYIQENNLAQITNYGEYFAQHPPTQEVRIKERTSWSCAHGVDRWENDCGCNSGGHSNWNQQWRRPLRRAFDWLRDDLCALYGRHGKRIFVDPWRARDEYIDVLMDRSVDNVSNFLARQCMQVLSPSQDVYALRMLEMQRHLMLMYTSCGWFFDEPTGPETVQVLQYAARAVQLGEQLFGGNREEQFLKYLDELCSNIPEFGNGRQIYDRFVHPAMLDLPGVAAHYAISSFFNGYGSTNSVYCYGAELEHVEMFEMGRFRLAAGSARITSVTTRAELDFCFAVLYAGCHNLRAGICPRQAHDEFASFIKEMRSWLPDAEASSAFQALEQFFGSDVYSLKSLFRDERRRIVSGIVESALADVDKLYSEVYEHNTALIGFLRELGMPLPPILRVSSEFVLNNTLRRYLTQEGTDLAAIHRLLETAAKYGISIDGSVKPALRQRLDALMQNWSRDPLQLELIQKIEPLVSFMRIPPFDADLWEAQNTYYQLMNTIASLKIPPANAKWLEHVHRLRDSLGFSDSVATPEIANNADEKLLYPRAHENTPTRNFPDPEAGWQDTIGVRELQ